MARQRIRARGFFQMSDLAKAAEQALRFAGDGGRLGTMLDVVDARLATTIGSNAWEKYWTTNSWELRGRSRGGVELLAVWHSGDPREFSVMAKAYERSTREDVGAKIPQRLFWDFLDGKFGPVATVELQPYLKRYQFPFLQTLTFNEALKDPVVRARLGPKAEQILRQHRTLASEFYVERGYDENNYLIDLESPSNCGYPYRELPEDVAFAHALAIGQPINMSHMPEPRLGEQRRYRNSFTVELGCHERGNGVRMFGIRGVEPLSGDIQPETKRSEKRRRRVPAPVITVIDPKHPVDYASTPPPPNYRCGTCGATGCKLWREYQTFLDQQTLSCARCAAESQGKDISDIDAHGKWTGEHGMRSDQIGWRIPAVPTEANDTFWGYTSVPEAGCQWWDRLPTLPSTPSAAEAA